MNIDLSRKNSRNLSALKNIDKSIEDIICDASHIAVYEFDITQQSWKRYNVEGATFIVKRVIPGNNPNNYLLIVLNKLGTDNLILDLADCKKAKIQVPYIMLRCSTKKAPIIFGLWFHSEIERESVFESINSILKLIERDSNNTKPSTEFLTDVEISNMNQKAAKLELNLSNSLKSLLNLKKENDEGKKNTIIRKERSDQPYKLISPSNFTGEKKLFYLEI